MDDGYNTHTTRQIVEPQFAFHPRPKVNYKYILRSSRSTYTFRTMNLFIYDIKLIILKIIDNLNQNSVLNPF